MDSDVAFYSSFCESVLGPDPDVLDLTSKSHRVSFLMHHYNMVPAEDRDLLWNLTRAYPTSPVYAFLALGVIGTNISRCAGVRRLSGDRTRWSELERFIRSLPPAVLGRE